MRRLRPLALFLGLPRRLGPPSLLGQMRRLRPLALFLGLPGRLGLARRLDLPALFLSLARRLGLPGRFRRRAPALLLGLPGRFRRRQDRLHAVDQSFDVPIEITPGIDILPVTIDELLEAIG